MFPPTPSTTLGDSTFIGVEPPCRGVVNSSLCTIALATDGTGEEEVSFIASGVSSGVITCGDEWWPREVLDLQEAIEFFIGILFCLLNPRL